jgi:hypothetical protein
VRFVTNDEWAQLRQMQTHYRDPIEADRAAVILMTEGRKTREAIAKELGMRIERVREIVLLFDAGGVDALRSPLPPPP